VVRNKLPSLYNGTGGREFVEAGTLMSYRPRFDAMVRRAVFFVNRILKGAKPADLPVNRKDQSPVAGRAASIAGGSRSQRLRRGDHRLLDRPSHLRGHNARYPRSTLDAAVGVPVTFFEMRILDEQGRKRTPAATCRRLGEQVWYDEGGAHPYSSSSSHHLPPRPRR
jgi:hypothetical protein